MVEAEEGGNVRAAEGASSVPTLDDLVNEGAIASEQNDRRWMSSGFFYGTLNSYFTQIDQALDKLRKALPSLGTRSKYINAIIKMTLESEKREPHKAFLEDETKSASASNYVFDSIVRDAHDKFEKRMVDHLRPELQTSDLTDGYKRDTTGIFNLTEAARKSALYQTSRPELPALPIRLEIFKHGDDYAQLIAVPSKVFHNKAAVHTKN